MSKHKFSAYYTLFDKSEKSNREVDVKIECENGMIFISPKGYGDATSEDGYGSPILLEVWNGELRIVAWADINEQDATHIISLEKARENLRKEEDTVEMSTNELDKLRREKLDDIFQNYELGLSEDDEYYGDDGWETIQPGNEYWRNFYVIYSNAKESTKHIFTIQFKPGSTEVDSAGPNY